MKRTFLFMSVVASLLIAGCSQDDVEPSEEKGKEKTYYMTVNMVSSDIPGARAADGYEDGSVEENKVTRVRFYFFNGVGGAVNVKPQNGGYVNYYDWIPGDGNQTQGSSDADDVESNLQATIVINTEDGDKIPQRMAALVNPRAELLGVSSLSMTELRNILANYADPQYTSEGTFVMFNSVYANNGIEIGSAPIEKKNLCEDQAEAIANPVILYVERCVAKVRVTLDESIGFENNKLTLKNRDGEPIKVEGQQVYLKLNNWGLTAETSEGRLVKRINPTWEGNWWNHSHRSCWAINSMTAKNQYYNYASINTSFSNELYTNENAQSRDIDGKEGDAKENTKVILKGTLCKEDGSAFTIASHLGVYFADDANLTKIKESFLIQLAVNGKRYYYESGNGRKQIGPDDIKIVIADQQQQEGSQNNCFVYPQLTTGEGGASAKTWYDSTDKNAQPIANAAAVINGDLANTELVHRGMVWNSGMTYYYFEILHPTEANKTEPGVVRNHIYATNVTKIAGLGTPVYDPEQVIYPEIPNPANHYVAAEINILSWHVVANNYELNW